MAVGVWVFKQTEGLLAEFGPERVIDIPISEAGAFGIAIGAAMTGQRPVFEVMFGDFITLVVDQLVNQAAKVRYMAAGQFKVPVWFGHPSGPAPTSTRSTRSRSTLGLPMFRD